MARIRVAACQINPTMGDLDANVERIVAAIIEAEAAGADVAVLPELAITGYPPEDLVLKPGFVADNLAALDRVAAATAGLRCVAVVGFVERAHDLHNAAAIISDGVVLGTYRKRHLPNYGVFDEARYFVPGDEPLRLWEIAGVRVGMSICEDVWTPDGPLLDHAAGGAELVLNLNGSPFHAGKAEARERMLATRAADASAALVYVNQVGGQDELVFDGASVVLDADGQVIARASAFVEELLVVDLDVRPAFRKRLLDPRGRVSTPPLPVTRIDQAARPAAVDAPITNTITPLLIGPAEVYGALTLGLRDYAHKNGFTDVVLGLSGGIDSSLVTALAVDALGAANVHAVALPSRYSSEGSITDAEKMAANLGFELRTIPIEPAFAPMLELLGPSFEGLDEDVTEENLQGRIRAALLLALANKFRSWLVLVCGNKSELAVGYTTVYGVDMAGGYAPIKDVFKTEVYDLCRWRNEAAGTDVIPTSVIEKPPSAELRPGQRDDQSLPPYDVLDPILEGAIEHDMTVSELIAAGHDPDIVRRILRLVDIAEWKRRQAPLGVRVTTKAFGKDRRVPVTNRYRG